MKFSIYQDSRDGARKANQDRIGYCYSRDALLMIVADGLGGHAHGELASQLVVQFLISSFQREARPSLAEPDLFLARNINEAHLALIAYAAGRQFKDPPRTTCVACIVQNGVAYWAHVGDSRLYHLRDGTLLSRTRDHSRVQMLIDAGRLTENGATRHPERNKIFNCIGSKAMPRVELSSSTPLKVGDTLLLCTDGVWGPWGDRELAAALGQDEIIRSVPAVMNEAEVRAGRYCDNLSVVAMTLGADDEPEEQPITERLSTQAMALGAFSTTTRGGKNPAGGEELTDEEIDAAIAEIRRAFHHQQTDKR